MIDEHDPEFLDEIFKDYSDEHMEYLNHPYDVRSHKDINVHFIVIPSSGDTRYDITNQLHLHFLSMCELTPEKRTRRERIE